MHHNNVPNLNPRTGITDLFVFQNSQDPTRSTFMLNVNPEVPTCPDPFDPETSYELKIDTNGDFEAEIAFHLLFSTMHGQQNFLIWDFHIRYKRL